MLSSEAILLIAAVLLLLGVLASKISARLGIPALLLFLLIGMLAGSEGPGGIPFEDPHLAQSVSVVALAYILFAGGLDTEWRSVSRSLWQGLSLSSLGVLTTAVITGTAAHLLLPLSWVEGVLLGSIVSSTDAAAVFAILRSHGISLKDRLKRLLELESGSNDPMAVFLTMACIRYITQPETSILDLAGMFLLQMVVGAAIGVLLGRGAVLALNRLRLESEGLYPVVTLAWVLLTYGAATSFGGNGYLAVYLAGITMGNADFIHKRSLMRFHDGLAWLMQITMFVLLGLLVFPSHLVPVAGTSILVAGVLMFLARPAAVFLSLALARVNAREMLLVSWVGLRGAVPVVLATFPFVAGVPNADLYFNVVFFTVITSVTLQGTTINPLARWLRLDMPLGRSRPRVLDELFAGTSATKLVEVDVPESSPVAGQRILDLHFPPSCLIVLLARDGKYSVPGGSTTVQPGDTLWVLGEGREIAEVRRRVE